MNKITLEKSIFLPTDTKTVWAYLTVPEKMEIWFHRPDQEFHEGVQYEITSKKDGKCLMWGKVLIAKAYEHLQFEFCVYPLPDVIGLVDIKLEAVEGGTKLSLCHSNLPDSAASFDVISALDAGWDKHLGSLREHAQA